ncbi:hypothetical protein [Candidatus Odyssella thessalonicensis]|uniref:hypothetical protein n=1 Tax=Candidatus Odyssella thessalonicensis TaxID=84647 RepID=UPI000225AF90|nr:hypothetical protein [Candidatus Odyssella thessalonicensis]
MKKNISLTVLLFLSLYFLTFNAIGNDINPENQPGYVYHRPIIKGDLSNFQDEKVIILYRGVNCLESKFTPIQRQNFLAENHVNQGMFASAAYELSGLDYNVHDDPDLIEHAQAVAEDINVLNFKAPYTVNGWQFPSKRFALQQLYSNNCLGFYKQLTDPAPAYAPIFDTFGFTKNPILSFSDRIKHPGKYGYGIKNFGLDTPLSAEYDINGKPKHPVLGKLYGVILDEAAVEELQPLNVAKAHHSNYLTLNTHYRNDILSEREIAIAGYIPGEYVVFEMPLQVPSFHHATCPSYYVQKYGLSQVRYRNYRRFFTSPNATLEARKMKETKLISELIQAANQDNNLRYMNCLDPFIPNLFANEFGRLNINIGQLKLDYTIE